MGLRAGNNNAGSTSTLATGTVTGGSGPLTAAFAALVDSPLSSSVLQISNTASIADDGTNGTDPTLGNNTASDTTPISGISYYTLAPCRVLDTRTAGGPLTSGTPRNFIITGVCGVPADAKVVAVNLTSVTPPATGLVNLYQGNSAAPATSVINFSLGKTRANNAIVQIATDGSGTLSATATFPGGGTLDIVVDVVGYFK